VPLEKRQKAANNLGELRRIDILSLFPEYFQGPFDVSMLKRAQEKNLLQIHLHNIRDFATDKHQRVDDRPFGGGPGMVMQPEPLVSAIRNVKRDDTRVVYLSPQGKMLNAATCRRLAEYRHLVLVCGHYEGIDQRVIDLEVDEEISIGDYVLTNGCVAAIVVVDAVSRFIPGVLGHPEAADADSFQEDGILEGPQYTRPVVFEEREVPAVLREGNHAVIAQWRKREALKKTLKVRPDLVGKITDNDSGETGTKDR
jgi:tRNA (guanine37-N1)-methyltransferase